MTFSAATSDVTHGRIEELRLQLYDEYRTNEERTGGRWELCQNAHAPLVFSAVGCGIVRNEHAGSACLRFTRRCAESVAFAALDGKGKPAAPRFVGAVRPVARTVHCT